ncbi:OmpA family protein [Variovorax sp. ZT4R33]|uniref:OmpA family protein n=1 Tax=Variovorax sp. ZT4R33 TaxID=3443743 RepID=UPI003F47D54B
MTFCRLAALAAASGMIAACSSPSTRVVLLPQPDGRASAVVVRTNGGEGVLAKPYQRATASRGATGAPAIDQADPVRIEAENRSLFDLMPGRPQRYTLYFDAGETALTIESQTTFNEALAAAAARSGGEIVVTGHTDTLGPLERNDELSRRRAQEVRQMFADRGFPANRIQAVGRGERSLAIPTADDVAEPRNRRVTIEVR